MSFMSQSLCEVQSARPTLTLTTVCIGYFMVVLDTTIVDVALPAVQNNLGANITELQWIVDSYVLVFASLLLTAGSLGDRFGAKQVFLVGTALFAAASGLCGAAPTVAILIASRAMQGIG